MQELPGLEMRHRNGRREFDRVDALTVIGHGPDHAGDLANYRHGTLSARQALARCSARSRATRSPAMKRSKAPIM